MEELFFDEFHFFTPESFELRVELFRKKYGDSYLDTIVTLLEEQNIDFNDANEYITPLLKMKLENELLKSRQLKHSRFQSNFEDMFS